MDWMSRLAPYAAQPQPGPQQGQGLTMQQYNQAAPSGYHAVGRKSLGTGLVNGVDYSWERVFPDDAYDELGNLRPDYTGRPKGYQGAWNNAAPWGGGTSQWGGSAPAAPWGAIASSPRFR